jgi:regulator of extracellular matrix RemA (YlzA/DUF370 family)
MWWFSSRTGGKCQTHIRNVKRVTWYVPDDRENLVDQSWPRKTKPESWLDSYEILLSSVDDIGVFKHLSLCTKSKRFEVKIYSRCTTNCAICKQHRQSGRHLSNLYNDNNYKNLFLWTSDFPTGDWHVELVNVGSTGIISNNGRI